MKPLTSFVAVCALVSGCAVLAADASAVKDYGKIEYRNSCALCHGVDGKAGLQVMDILKQTPTDLTTLSRINNGVFPFERVYMVIDGRQLIKSHGDRDMPVWGNRYSSDGVKAAEYYVDMPYNMEMYVRSRILALIDYLNRLQVK